MATGDDDERRRIAEAAAKAVLKQIPDDADKHVIAKQAADEAITKTFELLGVDINTEKGRSEFRETLSWARRVKDVSNKSTTAFLLTFITLIVTGVAYATWEGIKSFFAVVGGGNGG